MSIDTLRADRLGIYGYERDTSPALDRFAEERAVVFEHAIAESPWTLPSHVTLLSGLYPRTHGVNTPELAPSAETTLLAEILAAEGWYTFAVTDGGWMSAGWGFDRGFDSFHARDVDFPDAVDDVLEYVRFREGQGPWFGFLHTYDVHCPYDPPEPWFSRWESADAEPIEVAGRCGNPYYNARELTPGQVRYLSDRYDGGVGWVDEGLGRLFAGLAEAGVLDRTVVVITSDHGEELGEHGRIGHERTLHREVLEIPLLIAAPGLTPERITTPVGLADVAPTVLELLGLDPRATPRSRPDGTSLLSYLGGADGTPRGARRSDLAWQVELTSWLQPPDPAAGVGGEHWIHDVATGEVCRYDLAKDPAESRNLGGELPERFRGPDPGGERHLVPEPAAGAVETLRRLRELGY